MHFDYSNHESGFTFVGVQASKSERQSESRKNLIVTNVSSGDVQEINAQNDPESNINEEEDHLNYLIGHMQSEAGNTEERDSRYSLSKFLDSNLETVSSEELMSRVS